ncbi:MAG TPA: FlgD immunoglobulin-like domain containing protein, partial [Burkholderiales bacterium]|nr:FlgD immunoglobulin-like domain containing protein [Burkholderiales bacterium]
VSDFDQFDRAILVVGVSSLCGDAVFDYNYCAFLGNSTEQNATITFNNVTAGSTVWNMISNPLTMANTDPTAVFGNNIALANFAPTTAAVAPNQKTTSGFIFVNFLQGGASPPSQPLRFQRGRGFFLRTTTPGPFSASGTIAISCLPTDIPLNDNNWTIIGNPFFDDMPWNLDQILFNVNGASQGSLRSTLGNVNRAVEPYGWYWNPLANGGQGKYELVFDSTIIPGARASLLRGDGVFVKTNTSGVTLTMNQTNPNVSLSPVLRSSSVRRSATRSGFAANGNSWSVELKATAGSVSDEGALIGKTDSLQFSRGIQVDAPPAVVTGAGRIAVNLLSDSRSSRALKADVHGAGSDRDAWNLVVTTDQPNTEATLSWPNLVKLPRAQRMTLIDITTGQRLAMRTNGQYSFRTSAEPTTRAFRIELTPASEGGIRFSTVQTSLLGAGVHLSYVLNHEAQVGIRIVSPSGKVVRTLPIAPARTGLNTVTWDGKAQAGLALPRGVYLIELTARDDEGQETHALKSVAMK